MDGFDQETGEVIEQRPQLPAMAESRPQNLIFASPEVGEIFGALCVMQGSMDAPKRTKKAKVKGRTRNGGEYEYEYTYAPLDEIISAIKKPMAEADLAYRQFLAVRGGQHVMRTIVGHKGTGQWMATDYPIFWDEARGMQGFASGVTYARRYGLMLALGIAAEDDDDANVADGNPATVQDRQKGRSGSRAATKAAEATQVAEGPKQATAAPAGAAAKTKEEALAQWRNARDAIDACETIPEIEALFADPRWEGCQNIIRAGDPARADSAIQQLVDRAEDRKKLLMGGAGEPMSYGEMG